MPRLVNTAAAKRVPSTRCRARACDETSITTARSPAARKPSRRSCSSGASGVVCVPDSVPMTPVGRPAARRIDASRWVVVVLPLVPVMPTTLQVAARMVVDGRGDRPHRPAGVVDDELRSVDVERGGRRAAPSAPAATASRRRSGGRRRARRGRRRTDAPARDVAGVVGHRRHRRRRRRRRGAGAGAPGTAASSVPSGVERRGAGGGSHVGHSGAARRARRRFDARARGSSSAPARGTPARPPCRRSGRCCRGAAGRSTRGSSPADPRPGGSRRSWRSRPWCRRAARSRRRAGR